MEPETSNTPPNTIPTSPESSMDTSAVGDTSEKIIDLPTPVATLIETEQQHTSDMGGDEQEMTRLETIELAISDICKLARDRRSEVRNCLLYEKFSENNKNNYGTCRTSRPFEWFNAFQQYVATHQILTRCTIKRQKKINKVSIVKIHAVFKETKKVLLSLNFVTGVISVKERNFEEWIKDEFPLVCAFMCNYGEQEDEEAEESKMNNEVVNEVVGEDKNEEKTPHQTKADDSVKEELANIWSTIDGFKNAISSLEVGVVKLTERMDGLEIILKDYTIAQDNKRKVLFQKSDSRIALFEETATKTATENIKKLKSDVNTKIASVKLAMNTFKDEMEKRIAVSQSMPPSYDVDELSKKIIETEVRSGHYKQFEKDLNKLDEHFSQQISDVASGMSTCNTQVRTMKDEFDALNQQLRLRDKAVAGHVQSIQDQVNHLTTGSPRMSPAPTITTTTTPILTPTQPSKTSFSAAAAATPEATAETPTTDATAETATNVLNPQPTNPEHIREGELRKDTETILIMCMDSNSKYLDRRKLWDLNGTEFKRCGDLKKVNEHIDRKVLFTQLKYFFISVGCNDLDTKSGEEVFHEMKDTVLKLKRLHPNIKIIISEITPRMDDLDSEVREANKLLNELVKNSTDVYIVRNGNLRKKSFFYHGDPKHIRKDCIARFAANIKYTLRQAYGRPRYSTPNQPRYASANGSFRHNTTQHQHLSTQQQKLQQQQWINELRNSNSSTNNVEKVNFLLKEDVLRSLAQIFHQVNVT